MFSPLINRQILELPTHYLFNKIIISQNRIIIKCLMQRDLWRILCDPTQLMKLSGNAHYWAKTALFAVWLTIINYLTYCFGDHRDAAKRQLHVHWQIRSIWILYLCRRFFPARPILKRLWRLRAQTRPWDAAHCYSLMKFIGLIKHNKIHFCHTWKTARLYSLAQQPKTPVLI